MNKKSYYQVPELRFIPVHFDEGFCTSPLAGNGPEGFIIDEEGEWE